MRTALLRVVKTALSVLTGKGTKLVSALFFAFLVSLTVGISIYARSAKAVTNSTINFQARVLTAGGAVIPDGSVSIQFKIYDAASAGTNEWTETQSLTSRNGYITASLGSVTAFPGTIDWSQEHWLTMNVNSDGEMGPTRMKITAVPYSFRSGQADALTNGSGSISASQLAQLAPGTIQGVSSSNAALRINQTGAGALLQLQSAGTDKLTVANNGDTAVGGALTVTNGITVGNSTSTTAGTIRWTGTAFEGYNGTSWTSLGGGLVMSSGASASFISGLANVGANLTGTAVETLVFTTATAVSNTAGVTGFTAPADGSFRTCLVKNNAAITAGTLNVRWRVNGVSVGTGTCTMNSTTNRQSAASLDAGVVTFHAGDTIGVAFDTVGLAPTTDDFTVYWSVEYNSSSSSLTMQKVYDSSSAPVNVTTADAKDISYTLSNTTTDSNFLVDIAAGSTSKFAVQNNGTDVLSVNSTGISAGTLAVTGQTTLSSNLVASGSATGTVGTTGSPAQTNVTTVALTAAGSFANNDVIFINNAGQDYYTRIVSGGGTTSLTVSPAVSYDAGATVTKYTVQNIGATTTDYTTQANRFYQGYFLGGVVIGAGSTTISDGNIDSTTTLTLQRNGGVVSLGGNLAVAGTLSGDASGLTNINAASLTGTLPALSGSLITNIDAGNIATGTLSDSRLSTNVTLLGNTFNGNSQLVQLDASGNLPVLNGSALTSLSSGNLTGALPAISGAALTSLNGSNISSGTVADARLSTNVTLMTNTFNGANLLVKLDASGNLPVLNGSALTSLSSGNLTGALPAISGAALTNLNGTNISSGTVADARLSSNVGLLNLAQNYSAQQTFTANIIVGTDTASPTAGTIAFNDATAANGFTSVLGTNTLSATRAINLPDANGTVMLIAPSAVQVDGSTTQPSIFINKTGATANIMTLQKGGTPVFSVLNSGALAIQTTDTTAINIKNAGGTQYFNVDTSGGIVQIGGATADANATLLVLDTKNTTGDPTGTNGGSYYNSANNKFRCYEGGSWKDCISETTLTKTADQTVTNSATFTNDSTLVFAMAANSSYNVDAVINFSSTSAAADYKYTFTVPAGSTVAISATADTGAAAGTICNITASGQTCTLASTAGYRGNITLKGYIRTGGTAGNLQFQFAQNTQTAAQSVTVYQGSSLSYRKVQ